MGLRLLPVILGACIAAGCNDAAQFPKTAPAPVPVPVPAPAPAPAASASASAAAAAAAAQNGAGLLAAKRLIVPVEGFPPAALADTFEQARGGRKHEAIDIAALLGTRVVAVDDGHVAKLFTSIPGGLTVYQFDQEGRLAYYYAHLDRYAEGLREGTVLRRGDLVGYVGSTGNASKDAPHLHFAIFALGPAKQWWRGEALNPYPVLRRAPAQR